VDAVVVLPEAAPALEEDLRRGVVAELADRAALRVRERLQHLDVAQHRVGDRDDRVVALQVRAAGGGLVVHGDAGLRLVERDHARAEADAVAQRGQVRVRQLVRAAVDAHHVGVVAPDLLAQELEEARVHQRLLVADEPEQLDRRLGPALLLEELARRVAVVLRDDRAPRRVAVLLDALRERRQQRFPARARREPAVVLGELAAQEVGIRLELAKPQALAEQVAIRLGVVRRERLDVEPKRSMHASVSLCASGMRIAPASA
jgi:hypothetical protein